MVNPEIFVFQPIHFHSAFYSGYLQTLSFEIFHEETAIMRSSNYKGIRLTWAISIFNFFDLLLVFSNPNCVNMLETPNFGEGEYTQRGQYRSNQTV